MTVDPNERLGRYFTVGELIHSDAAMRRPEILKQQMSPSVQVLSNLTRLVRDVLDPLRAILNRPIRITSGYRCRDLNDLVGGSDRSQHVEGLAADCHLQPEFITASGSDLWRTRRQLSQEMAKLGGVGIDPDPAGDYPPINADYCLFAMAVTRMQALPIDQVIHEFGSPGKPAWVHISTRVDPRGRILVAGNYPRVSYDVVGVATALSLRAEA